MLSGSKPVTQKVMPHRQAQASDQNKAQPPIVENDRSRHNVLMVTVPIHHQRENKGGKRDRFANSNERVITKVPHYRTVHAKTDKQRYGNDRSADKQPQMATERSDHLLHAKTDQKRQVQC
ncbi:hypothetical protein D3C80_833730 [compost metagenome]